MNSISLIIPLFNESKRLKQHFESYIIFLKAFKEKELIFVDDGSNDDTLEQLNILTKQYNLIKIISYEKNKGKGYAIKSGVLTASCNYIMISDCDLSTPLEDFFKLEKYLDQYDIVIGSRRAEGAQVIVKQNFLKELCGRIGALVSTLFLNLNILDTQCGFKVFNQKIKPVFRKQRMNGFSFDFEILFLAKLYKLTIKEVGITWKNDINSKVKFSDYFKSLYDLIRIRLYYLRGQYNN